MVDSDNERAYLLAMSVKYMPWIHQVESMAKRRLTDHEILKLWDWLVLVGIETEESVKHYED
jgi:hypothetical protein